MKISKSGNDHYLIDDTNLIDELPVGNYIIMQNENTGQFYLQKKEDFKLPPKIYGKDTNFINRVLKTYAHLGNRETLGILLNGLKGTGKTIDAELIAIESGLPVLFLTKAFIDINFKNFLSSITQEFVLFIDEFEKIYDYDTQEHLLSIFDGMLSNKKIVIMTCNKDHINEYFNNRLKRIRYRKTYTNLSEIVTNEVIEDLLNDKSQKDNLFGVISEIGIITMDILISIIEEMNIHSYTATEAVTYLNVISEKVEYRVGRVLPSGIIKELGTFNSAANGSKLRCNIEFKLENFDSNTNVPLPEFDNEAYLNFDSSKHKLTKVKHGLYKAIVPVNVSRWLVETDEDFAKEDPGIHDGENTVNMEFVFEKDSLFNIDI